MQKLFGTIKMKLLYKTQLVTMPTNDTTRCRMITVHHKLEAALPCNYSNVLHDIAVMQGMLCMTSSDTFALAFYYNQPLYSNIL